MVHAVVESQSEQKLETLSEKQTKSKKTLGTGVWPRKYEVLSSVSSTLKKSQFN
jgi:hypothetical protein